MTDPGGNNDDIVVELLAGTPEASLNEPLVEAGRFLLCVVLEEPPTESSKLPLAVAGLPVKLTEFLLVGAATLVGLMRISLELPLGNSIDVCADELLQGFDVLPLRTALCEKLDCVEFAILCVFEIVTETVGYPENSKSLLVELER